MTTYADVQAILDKAIDHKDIGGHGAFWRKLSRDEFVAFEVAGKIALLSRDASGSFDAEGSNLIHALQGTGMFGADTGNDGAKYDRMPMGLAPVSDDQISVIKHWIGAGCPA